VRRREFITLVGGAGAAWPLAAHAQQRERMRRIGVLMARDNEAIVVRECRVSCWLTVIVQRFERFSLLPTAFA
jgi:putative tryptophan/tyrosine transport system substrate-binding protein